jgi:hypothetical protein
VKVAAEKSKVKKIMELLCKRPVIRGFGILMAFDIFRYVLIFLMIFGHNLGTKERSCFVVDRLFQR